MTLGCVKSTTTSNPPAATAFSIEEKTVKGAPSLGKGSMPQTTSMSSAAVTASMTADPIRPKHPETATLIMMSPFLVQLVFVCD